MSATVARRREQWEAVMDGFQSGRRHMLQVAFDEAERTLRRPPGSVLDVGGGPGTTAEAVLHRWSGAQVTLLDIDPVMLSLARTALPAAQVRHADLRTPGWSAAAGGPHDLVLVVMTLHYLPEADARRLYAEVFALLRRPGMLLVADMLTDLPTPPRVRGDADHGWSSWWRELAADPHMATLFGRRDEVLAGRTSAEFVASESWHRDAARRAGFADCRPVWRQGELAVLAMST